MVTIERGPWYNVPAAGYVGGPETIEERGVVVDGVHAFERRCGEWPVLNRGAEVVSMETGRLGRFLCGFSPLAEHLGVVRWRDGTVEEKVDIATLAEIDGRKGIER